MKYFLAFLILLSACKSDEQKEKVTDVDSLKAVQSIQPSLRQDPSKDIGTDASHKIYSNQRFKEVTVVKQNDSTWQLKGKAQIFEARFGWIIEDGDKELQHGSSMTNAGAAEWGSFSFTVKATKLNTENVLHLILFESSAKDGSRQDQLPVLLY